MKKLFSWGMFFVIVMICSCTSVSMKEKENATLCDTTLRADSSDVRVVWQKTATEVTDILKVYGHKNGISILPIQNGFLIFYSEEKYAPSNAKIVYQGGNVVHLIFSNEMTDLEEVSYVMLLLDDSNNGSAVMYNGGGISLE